MFLSSHELGTCTLPGRPSRGLLHCLGISYCICMMLIQDSSRDYFLLFKDFFALLTEYFPCFLNVFGEHPQDPHFSCQILQPLWSINDPVTQFFLLLSSQTQTCIKFRHTFPFLTETVLGYEHSRSPENEAYRLWWFPDIFSNTTIKVDILVFLWNILTTSGWVCIKFGTDIHVSQSMNPNDCLVWWWKSNNLAIIAF